MSLHVSFPCITVKGMQKGGEKQPLNSHKYTKLQIAFCLVASYDRFTGYVYMYIHVYIYLHSLFLCPLYESLMKSRDHPEPGILALKSVGAMNDP